MEAPKTVGSRQRAVGESQLKHFLLLPSARCALRKKNLFRIRRGLGRLAFSDLLSFPLKDDSFCGQELAPVRRSLTSRPARLLWRLRAQPSATLDKKRYSIVEWGFYGSGWG